LVLTLEYIYKSLDVIYTKINKLEDKH
jgi:hypothetical protein